MEKSYILKLNNEIIGYTKFEHADVSMGVIHGKVIIEGIFSPYTFFRDHCVKFNVQINSDFPKEKFISTQIIPQLEVFLENGDQLKGSGGAIAGMEPDDFAIDFYGIAPELMQAEFSHHFVKYYGDE